MGKFGNVEKMIGIGNENWHVAETHGLTGIRVKKGPGNRLEAKDGHQFINMSCCSYLGLDRHPKILDGAIDGIRRAGTLWLAVSRARIGTSLIDEAEEPLREVFDCAVISAISCSAASAGILPILASGHLTGRKKPLMIFDKHCHFSMKAVLAACGDETDVVTCNHNDLDFIENACKTHSTVAYVADGAYSLGGMTLVPELLALQERYGLFLYLDDSHSISIYGKRGAGLVRSQMGKLSDRTIIVGSLAKGFGATGAVIMLGHRLEQDLFQYSGGQLSWSQGLNSASLGAIRASAEIHLTDELTKLQEQLRSVMDFFDATIPTSNAGNGLPVRVIDLPDVEQATAVSAKLYRRGFYSSAVFFPITAHGRAGLRAMGRADLDRHDILRFCEAIQEATRASSIEA